MSGFQVRLKPFFLLKHQGPVVQNIVSLTSLLRGLLVKCFMTLLQNILIFFVEKISFCNGNASLIFSTKNIGIFDILTFEILMKCSLTMSLVLNNQAQYFMQKRMLSLMTCYMLQSALGQLCQSSSIGN